MSYDNNKNNNNYNNIIMVPQSWILHCFKTYKIPDKVKKFIEKTIETWKLKLTTGGKSLVEDPERYIPRRCPITNTICNSDDDASQSHFQEMHRRIQI